MHNTSSAQATTINIISWLFGILVVVIGLLNLFLVHLVPGIAYLLLSFIYLPPASSQLKAWFGFALPPVVKILLAIVIVLFTLGVSDLGDMIDKL